MSTVAYPHIAIRSDGHPITADSHYKVRLLVEEHLNGATPAEMQEAHPRLTLSEIYASLSYYHDHKQEMDAEMARLEELAQKMMAEQGESILHKRFRAMTDEELKSLYENLGRPSEDSVFFKMMRAVGRTLP